MSSVAPAAVAPIEPPSLSMVEPSWQPLRYFTVYRVVLAALMVALVEWGGAPRPLGLHDLTLFRATAGLYLALAIVVGTACHARWPAFQAQVGFQVCADIVAITILMHASGGLSSGFGLLLVVAIAGGSILTQGRIAVLFAAFASLAVLAQQIFVWLDSPFSTANYPHAGILGGAFFATAWLSWTSAQRLRASEALAARREVDLANLAQVSQHIIERMQSGILAIDPDHIVRLANKSAQRMLGLPERPTGHGVRASSPALGRCLDQWYPGSDRSTYLLNPDGAQVPLQASFAALGAGASDGILVFLEDTTEINQRAHDLKLASLGRLSAGIAHEIRNPLSAISHAGQLLDESPNLDADDQRLTRIIRDNSARTDRVIENVLQIGRGRPAEPTSILVADWLGSLVDELGLVGLVARENVVIDVDPPDVVIRADPSQLRQIVWNLCENAVQHSGEQPRLVLRGSISRENRRPIIEVRDQGEGLDPALVEEVFEPFFTSRAQGTGLGLYIARELCAGNQASLTHVPTDSGCCFRITFSDPRRQRVAPT